MDTPVQRSIPTLPLYRIAEIDLEVLPIFGFSVAIWSTIFLEKWKREQATYTVKWGMDNAMEKEPQRPEFVGDWHVSPLTGQLEVRGILGL
jgi:hypothetical protein